MSDLFGIGTAVGIVIGLIFIVAPMEYYRIQREREHEEKMKNRYNQLEEKQ